MVALSRRKWHSAVLLLYDGRHARSGIAWKQWCFCEQIEAFIQSSYNYFNCIHTNRIKLGGLLPPPPVYALVCALVHTVVSLYWLCGYVSVGSVHWCVGWTCTLACLVGVFMLFLAGISVDCPSQKFRTSTYNSCYWNVIYKILLSLVQLTHLYKQLIISWITVFTTTDRK